MPTIRIQRTSEFQNLLRDYKLVIDGYEVGRIANGETKDFTTSIGQHTVTAKIDWCSSNDLVVDVRDNEVKILKLSGFKNDKWLFAIIFVIMMLNLVLSVTFKFDIRVSLIFILFLLFLYTITIGRKKYLLLKEIDKQIE